MSAVRIGVDLVEIDRIRQAAGHGRFLEHVFSPQERALMERRKDPFPGYAANFAAKEAFSKALGTGVRGFALAEVSVLRDERGAPYFVFSGTAKELAAGASFSVSLTHTDTLAEAMVIATNE